MDRPDSLDPAAEPRATLAGGRLVIRGTIATGATGEIFRALDHARGHEVAIKVLRDATPDAVRRIRTAVAARADVRHPNLVQVHELVEADASVIVTMELVTGVDFLRWVRPVPTGDGELGLLDENRLRRAAAEIARGLLALHHAGCLHRELLPANVVVTDAGRVVILAGGLLAPPLGARADAIAAYLAPEQGAGRRLTPRSDWYALGALLYHALAGRPPFLGSATEVNDARLGDEPPRPSTFVPGIAPDLDQLAVDLLRRRPRQRPTGLEVVRRLGETDDDLETGDGTDDLALPLVGRERELAVLAPLAAKGWGPRLAVVTGPAGVGKTALIREAVRRLELRRPEAWAVWSRGEPDGPTRDGLTEVVAELARRMRGLPDAAREELAGVARPVTDAADTVGIAAATARGTALGALLAGLGIDRPLIVVLDDLHRWPASDLAALRAALDASARPSVVVIAIGRDDGAWRGALAEPALTLVVGELDQDAALALAGHRVIPEEAVGLVATTGGHPGLLVEVSRHAADLPTWYADRRGRLPAAGRTLVEVVARADLALAPAVAARAAALADAAPGAVAPCPALGDELVAELVAARLVRRGVDGRLAIYHARVGAAAIAALPEPRRRLIDRALAEALGAAEPLAAARRWHAAGDLAAARAQAIRAASAASTAGAYDLAIAAYQLAIACDEPARAAPHPAEPGAPDATGALYAALGQVQGMAGRVDDAVRSYRAAAERSSPPRALAARRRAAELLLHDGQIDAGSRLFIRVLADLGLAAVPRRGPGELAALVAAARGGGGDAEALVAARLDTTWAAATAWSELDPVRTARLRQLYVGLALPVGDTRRRLRALVHLATVASARRHPDHAARWAAALAVAADTGLAQDPAFTDGPTAYAALHAGDVGRAAMLFDHVLAGLRERGLTSSARGAAALALALAARAHAGDLTGLRAVIDRHEDHGARDRLLGLELATGGAALLGLAGDDPAGVLASAERAARWPGRGFTGVTHQRVFAAWHAHVYRGDAAAARGEIEAAYPAARRAGATLVAIARLDLLRMRALARALTRDRVAAARDRDRVAAVPLPLAAPAADGITAALALAARDPAAAAAAWRRSAEGLARAGLTLHARAAAWRAALAEARDGEATAIAAGVAHQGVVAPARLLAALAPA